MKIPKRLFYQKLNNIEKLQENTKAAHQTDVMLALKTSFLNGRSHKNCEEKTAKEKLKRKEI